MLGPVLRLAFGGAEWDRAKWVVVFVVVQLVPVPFASPGQAQGLLLLLQSS